jgi:hypothetical protein
MFINGCTYKQKSNNKLYKPKTIELQLYGNSYDIDLSKAPKKLAGKLLSANSETTVILENIIENCKVKIKPSHTTYAELDIGIKKRVCLQMKYSEYLENGHLVNRKK